MSDVFQLGADTQYYFETFKVMQEQQKRERKRLKVSAAVEWWTTDISVSTKACIINTTNQAIFVKLYV